MDAKWGKQPENAKRDRIFEAWDSLSERASRAPISSTGDRSSRARRVFMDSSDPYSIGANIENLFSVFCRPSSLFHLSGARMNHLRFHGHTTRSGKLRWSVRLLGVIGLMLNGFAMAEYRSYPLPAPQNAVVGQLLQYPAQHEDTLLDIARRFSLGHDEIIQANPQVDKWLPGAGTPVLLPTQFILPRGPREGIILNVPEMRLYYFPPASKALGRQVITYPVSIGRMDWNTPLGMTRVVRKDKDPAWYPPASIKKEHAERGDILPDIVPPGPDNPLGQHAMRLGFSGYLIHGTNNPWGIGMRVTHGCVRMYPEDVAQLFKWVDVGTSVEILNDPVKVGWLDGALYLEVHEPLEETNANADRLYEMAMQAILSAVGNRPVRISWALVRDMAGFPDGVPRVISIENTSGPAQQVTPAPQARGDTTLAHQD